MDIRAKIYQYEDCNVQGMRNDVEVGESSETYSFYKRGSYAAQAHGLMDSNLRIKDYGV